MRATKSRLIQVATCFEDQAPSLSDLTDDALSARRDELTARQAELAAMPSEDMTDDDITELEGLAARMTAVRAEFTKRLAAAINDTPVETPEVETPVVEETLAAEPVAGPAPVSGAPAAVTEPPAGAATKLTKLPIYAAVDVKGVSADEEMDMAKLARVVAAKATSIPKGRPSKRNEYVLATIRKHFDSRAIVTGNNAEAAIAFASDERNTPKGSLTASGGWCAPSETLYELAAQLSSTEGLYSLPEILAARGGFNTTLGPDFASVFADTGFCFTEGQDIAGDYDAETPGVQGKPCFKVECPDFTETRLDVCGLCISAGYLQNRAYPELTERTVSEALVAHQHRLAGRILADVIAGSDPVDLTATGIVNPGALTPILDAIELQVWDARYKHRMSTGRTLEAVFPLWVKGLIRSDLSKRLGVDLLSVGDARIAAWFAERGVSPQFIYNFDDLGNLGAASAYPSTVRFVLYPAGTWVRASSDVIDLGVVHDSTQFAFNNYTALFTEEGWAVIKRGHESRVVEVAVCPSGATGAGVDLCVAESPES